MKREIIINNIKKEIKDKINEELYKDIAYFLKKDILFCSYYIQEEKGVEQSFNLHIIWKTFDLYLFKTWRKFASKKNNRPILWRKEPMFKLQRTYKRLSWGKLLGNIKEMVYIWKDDRLLADEKLLTDMLKNFVLNGINFNYSVKEKGFYFFSNKKEILGGLENEKVNFINFKPVYKIFFFKLFSKIFFKSFVEKWNLNWKQKIKNIDNEEYVLDDKFQLELKVIKNLFPWNKFEEEFSHYISNPAKYRDNIKQYWFIKVGTQAEQDLTNTIELINDEYQKVLRGFWLDMDDRYIMDTFTKKRLKQDNQEKQIYCSIFYK